MTLGLRSAAYIGNAALVCGNVPARREKFCEQLAELAMFLLPRFCMLNTSSKTTALSFVPFHGVVTQANKVAKSFGRRAAFHDLQQRIVNRVMRFQVLKGMIATADDIDKKFRDAGGLQTRFATREELMTAAANPEIAAEMTTQFIDEAIERGDECYGIFDGSKLVSYGWYSNTPTQLTSRLMLHFDRAWMYMYKGFTLRSHRGKRLHGIGMCLACHAYTDQGHRGLISYVNSTNFESLRSTSRMGYRMFGDLYIAEAAGRAASWATPGCTPYGFRAERRR